MTIPKTMTSSGTYFQSNIIFFGNFNFFNCYKTGMCENIYFRTINCTPISSLYYWFNNGFTMYNNNFCTIFLCLMSKLINNFSRCMCYFSSRNNFYIPIISYIYNCIYYFTNTLNIRCINMVCYSNSTMI